MKLRKMVKWVIGTVVSVSLMCGLTMGAYAAYNDEIVMEDMDVAENLEDVENIEDGSIGLGDTKFVGKLQGEAITGEEEAVHMVNGMVPYAVSGELTYSWALYPKYAIVPGAEAKAVSKAKKDGALCKIDSIYARASIILKDGTKIIKKHTKQNASRVKAEVYDDCYSGDISCFKSGHKFVNSGYNTMVKHITEYAE